MNTNVKKGCLGMTPAGRALVMTPCGPARSGTAHAFVVVLHRDGCEAPPSWTVHDGSVAFSSPLAPHRGRLGLFVGEKSSWVLGHLARTRQKDGRALYVLRGEPEDMGGRRFWTPVRGDRMIERREIVKELNAGTRVAEREEG